MESNHHSFLTLPCSHHRAPCTPAVPRWRSFPPAIPSFRAAIENFLSAHLSGLSFLRLRLAASVTFRIFAADSLNN